MEPMITWTSLREALLIATAAIALAFTVNALRPDGLDLAGGGPQKISGNAVAAGGHEITIEEARQAHAQGSAVFADARSAADYAAGHIEGAISLPEHDLEAWVEGFIARTDPATVIITYCDGGECPLARALAEKLVELGYANTRFLSDGWGKWKERGLPTAQGS